MPKIPDCDALRAGFAHRCSLYAHNPHLVCAVHPDGIDTESCLDSPVNILSRSDIN
jgi:hypothetical protein